ncbi:hypothetical protein SKAU_G00256160 [Synaphobranchus kaupii]|uniref:Uncharacterized protein n=1 Tax=Synaphobranchus kaupii TaxID=118154 RepID=A0A9Q1F408_SYNKA|nr:hypothetical protein SKAU_G00256160 [Synaphobranchus kaupii]
MDLNSPSSRGTAPDFRDFCSVPDGRTICRPPGQKPEGERGYGAESAHQTNANDCDQVGYKGVLLKQLMNTLHLMITWKFPPIRIRERRFRVPATQLAAARRCEAAEAGDSDSIKRPIIRDRDPARGAAEREDVINERATERSDDSASARGRRTLAIHFPRSALGKQSDPSPREPGSALPTRGD